MIIVRALFLVVQHIRVSMDQFVFHCLCSLSVHTHCVYGEDEEIVHQVSCDHDQIQIYKELNY